MIVRILGALLIAQLAVATMLYWPQSTDRPDLRALVTTVNADTVDRIELSNNDGATLVLVRQDQNWRLDIGLPADGSKINTLLGALTNSDPGFPIADSDTAAQRFEVSAQDFQRKITLSSPDTSATVFAGTAAGLRKIHARVEPDTAVYVLPFGTFDAPVDIDSWLDTRMLARPRLSRFTLYGVEFELKGGDWSRSDAADIDDEQLRALTQSLASLQVTGLVDAADEDAARAGERLRMALGDDPGEKLTVLHNPDSDQYYLQSGQFGEIFSTTAYDAERLINAVTALFNADEDKDTEMDGETDTNANTKKAED